MHLKKFAALFLGLLGLGFLLLSFKELLFIAGAESQVAQVSHHVPGKTEKFYKMSGSYEEKSLAPAISYSVDGEKITTIPEYSCKDGCQKVGSTVTVFYNKKKPQDVLIMSFGSFWKHKVYFFIVMMVLLLTSLPYVYYHSSKPRESGSIGQAD